MENRTIKNIIYVYITYENRTNLKLPYLIYFDGDIALNDRAGGKRYTLSTNNRIHVSKVGDYRGIIA